MDLWDVVKLMVRRWTIALPLLALTAIAAVTAALTIKPDYTATSNMSLLPPSVQHGLAQGGGTTVVNPWTTESLTAAIVVKLRSLDLADELNAAGYEGKWQVDRDVTFYSVMIIKVTAPSRESARATAMKLVEMAQQEVKRQQADYQLKPGEEITTRLLDPGSVEATTTKLKRALIVVLGVGFIVTVALTIGLDAWLRRREARRMERPGGGSDRATGAAASLDSAALRRGLAAQSRQPLTANSERTRLIRPRVAAVEYASANAATNGATEPLANAGESEPDQQPGAGRAEPEASIDATIILPLTNAPWRSRSGRDSQQK